MEREDWLMYSTSLGEALVESLNEQEINNQIDRLSVLALAVVLYLTTIYIGDLTAYAKPHRRSRSS